MLLEEVYQHTDFRPAGWPAVARELLRHPIPYVRVLAALSLPAGLDATFNKPVAALAGEHSLPMQIAFCQAAGDSHMPYAEQVLNILDTTQNREFFLYSLPSGSELRRER